LSLSETRRNEGRIDVSEPKPKSFGPHSRAFRAGALGDRIDGRSREGRFLRKVEAELVAQIGGQLSFAQTLLIRRIARATLQLELLDEKMMAGAFTAYDARIQGGLQNAVRLMLREIGIKAAPKPKATLAAYLADKAAK
jgi:hypothetical protein